MLGGCSRTVCDGEGAGREHSPSCPHHGVGAALGVVISGEIAFPSYVLTQKSGLECRSIRMAFTELGPAHILGYISK